jgi:hypothetical protein
VEGQSSIPGGGSHTRLRADDAGEVPQDPAVEHTHAHQLVTGLLGIGPAQADCEDALGAAVGALQVDQRRHRWIRLKRAAVDLLAHVAVVSQNFDGGRELGGARQRLVPEDPDVDGLRGDRVEAGERASNFEDAVLGVVVDGGEEVLRRAGRRALAVAIVVGRAKRQQAVLVPSR